MLQITEGIFSVLEAACAASSVKCTVKYDSSAQFYSATTVYHFTLNV